ncbi:MAG: Fe(2+)-trafficking protein [Deltaproteobacteria bacterium]|nr:Fe(2+)-trafficking protein [Deltaproteobacteria bacterium]MDZ4224510.1 Fe(2+)-trafficking protein [bacterium]
MNTIKCVRCGADAAPPDFVPYPAPLKAAIEAQVCGPCWEEWKKRSVMVVNEYKLTPFLPQHREILEQQMKEFLGLKI